MQGAAQVRKRRPEACLIFLLPPSLAILEERLRGRGTDDEAVIQRRMAMADRELAAAELFDYAVINDDLDRAVAEVLEIIAAVRAGRGAEIRPTHGLTVVIEDWSRRQDV